MACFHPEQCFPKREKHKRYNLMTHAELKAEAAEHGLRLQMGPHGLFPGMVYVSVSTVWKNRRVGIGLHADPTIHPDALPTVWAHAFNAVMEAIDQ